jgi:hypothetical protein
MLAIMLHGDGIALDLALTTVAQCGIVSLELLQVLYNAEFELLGINAAMLDLRKDLLDRYSVRPVLSTWMPREQAPRAGRVIDRSQVREMTTRGKAAAVICWAAYRALEGAKE